MKAKTDHCVYCGRDDVPFTKKGYLKPHMGKGGLRCIFVIGAESRIHPKPPPPKRLRHSGSGFLHCPICSPLRCTKAKP